MILENGIATIDNGAGGLALSKLDEALDKFEAWDDLEIGVNFQVGARLRAFSQETADRLTLAEGGYSTSYCGIPIEYVGGLHGCNFVVVVAPNGDFVKITNIDIGAPVTP